MHIIVKNDDGIPAARDTVVLLRSVLDSADFY